MKDNDTILTLQELEELCRLYLECRLSVLEEKELELILTTRDASSPLIDETRAVMGVSASMQAPCRRKGWSVRHWVSAAAVALLAAVAVPLVATHLNSEEYVSYSNGKRLEPEQAKIHAIEQMKKMDLIIENMDYIILEKQKQYENFNQNLASYP